MSHIVSHVRSLDYDCCQNIGVEKIARVREAASSPLASSQSQSFKMEAASRANESSFGRISGQGTTDSNPSVTNSSMDSVQDGAYESSPASASRFQTGFDTPQSSVVDMILRQGPQQRRVARFVECFCVSGGPWVGTGGQATCSCGARPEVVEAPKKAEKRSIKKCAKAVSRGFKRAWSRRVQAITDGARRVLRGKPAADRRGGGC
jgi:hypothetical protein